MLQTYTQTIKETNMALSNSEIQQLQAKAKELGGTNENLVNTLLDIVADADREDDDLEWISEKLENRSIALQGIQAHNASLTSNINTFQTQFEADKASGKIAPFYEFTWDKVFGEKQVEQKTQTVQGIAQNVQQQQQFNAQLGQLRSEILDKKTAEQEYASRKANMQKMILIGAGAVLFVVIVGVLIWKFK